MNYSYVIIDDDQESILKTKAIADGFSELSFIGSVQNAVDGLNLILEKNPLGFAIKHLFLHSIHDIISASKGAHN